MRSTNRGLLAILILLPGSVAWVAAGPDAGAPASWFETVGGRIADAATRGEGPTPSRPDTPAGISPRGWASILRQIAEADFEARPAPAEDPSATWLLTNRPQALESRFGTGGWRVGPLGGDAAGWSFGLALVGMGPAGAAVAVAPAEPVAMGNRVEYRRPGLTEWYVNDHRGVEQGFTLLEPPAGRPTQVELLLEPSGSLSPAVSADAGDLTLLDVDGTPVLRYGGLHAFDATGRTLAARMDLPAAAGGARLLRIAVDVADAVFPVVVDPLIATEVKKLTAAGTGVFGFSVSISGDAAVVGAYFSGNSSGWAFVFERNAGGADNWGQVKTLTAVNTGWFGFSVSISGDTVVVGAPEDDDFSVGVNTGSAYVFERNAGGADNWGQVKKLTAADAAAADRLGSSVSISADTVVVGADQFTVGGKGKAYVFERDAGGADNWGQIKKLTAADGLASDRFGISASIGGDTVVVGSHRGDAGPGPLQDTGSAYVFERDAGGADNWGQVKELTAADAVMFDSFGVSVSISGHTIVVGANNDDASVFDVDAGSVYVFGRNAGGAENWGQVNKLMHTNHTSLDNLGISVSIDGNLVVAGAYGHDGAGAASGAAYVFELDAGGAGGQVLKLTAADAAAEDWFGISVSISGDTVVVGANYDDDVASQSGSAYVYQLSLSAFCGDALQEPPEECDDGAGNSDVMPDACRTDCRLAGCGDGVADTGEDCDDGNTAGGDDCAADCSVAAGGVPGGADPGGGMLLSWTGSSIEVTFEPACSATDHAAYWGHGPIGSAGLEWTDSACGLGTTGTGSFDPGILLPGEWLYFVVVGYDGDIEGSYGVDSAPAERPEAVGVGACDRPAGPSTCP